MSKKSRNAARAAWNNFRPIFLKYYASEDLSEMMRNNPEQSEYLSKLLKYTSKGLTPPLMNCHHIVPLSKGGSPNDPRNILLMPVEEHDLIHRWIDQRNEANHFPLGSKWFASQYVIVKNSKIFSSVVKNDLRSFNNRMFSF